jgi:pimeloyl-ACP methyl ester carboxylesterase
MLHIPAPSGTSKSAARNELLFVYGHHSSLERWWGMMEVLNEFGSVTMPDLPGFGGMESFSRIGQKPTIDNMADYLAAFIKWRYKRKKVIIAGMSFGFVVVTRMLQRYPELISKVELCISIAGFSHEDDFIFPKWKHNLLLAVSRTLSYRLPAAIFKAVALNPVVLRIAYRISENEKFTHSRQDKEAFEKQLAVEVRLWRDNDVATAMQTSAEFLKLDNCRQRIDLDVYHIGVEADRYFDNHIVEQHMRVIFNDFHLVATLDLVSHAPSVVATAAEAAPFVPEKLRQLLRQT